MRRPSPALLVALLALFVALGGPARAARLISGSEIERGSITSKQVKNRSLAVKDLSRGAARWLRITPMGSITESKLANGAVSSAKLGGAAVTGAKLAADSVGPIQIADGKLTAADVARFAGSLTANVAAPGHGCWAIKQPLGADVSNAVFLVTPGSAWPRNQLDFAVQSAPPDGFTIAGCNRTGKPVSVPGVVFRYVVFQLP